MRCLTVVLLAGALCPVVDAHAARWDTRLVSHTASSQSHAGNGSSVTTKLGVDASSEGFFPLASAPLTPDGRWALIQSAATNLVDAVTEGNAAHDVFVFDRDTGDVTSPWLLMAFSAVLALIGSVWVERYGGNVLAPRARAEFSPAIR